VIVTQNDGLLVLIVVVIDNQIAILAVSLKIDPFC
jgi:hypothetical protein